MTRALHVLKKDLYHARWLIAGWCLVVALQAWYRGARLGLGPAEVRRTMWAPNSMTAVTWLQAVALAALLLAIVIVSALVHDDPVPDTQAFWLTRPIRRREMFAAKVLGLLSVIVLPGLIAESVLMALWGVGAVDILHANAELLLVCATGLSLLFAAAAVTRHGGEMLIVVGGVTAALLLASAGLLGP